jgi:hypothetical protein
VSYDRQGISDHANNLASTIQLNLKRSLESIGVVSFYALCSLRALCILTYCIAGHKTC